MILYNRNQKIYKLYKKGKIVTRFINAGNNDIESCTFIFNPFFEYLQEDDVKIEYIIKSNNNEWDFEIKLDNVAYDLDITKNTGIIDVKQLVGDLSTGEHQIIIAVRNKNTKELFTRFINTITVAGSVIVSERNRMPYISLYYIDPIVELNKEWSYEIYIDDYFYSWYTESDKRQKFDIHIMLEGHKDIVLENVSAGNRFITMPALTEYGFYDFGVYCVDEQGRKSHTVWNEVWVKPEIEEKVFNVTDEVLAQYGITNKRFEYLVPVYIAPEEFTAGSLIDTRDAILAEKDVVKNYQIPSGCYALFMPDLDNDGQYDNYNKWLYNVQYAKYADDYNEETMLSIANATRLGLQQLIDDVIAEGYTKMILPKDGYFVVDHRTDTDPSGASGSIYIEAENFTLDLNGSTLKLHKFTGNGTVIIAICHCHNVHVINGIVDGDAFTHDYDNSPNNSEWCILTNLSASMYSSYENIVCMHSAGYGFCGGDANNRSSTKGYTVAYPRTVGSFTAGDIDDNGNLIDADDRAVTDFVDVSDTVNKFKTKYNKKQARFQVSKYLGYQGNYLYNWCFKLCMYDKDKNYLGSDIGYQYRNMSTHENTHYVRVVALAPLANINQDVSVMTFIHNRNTWCRNITIKEVRGTGGAFTGMNNCLFENFTIDRVGHHVTPVGFDLEDGWDMMQDITFRNFNVIKRAGTADLMTCAGHNIIVEDMQEGSYYMYGRTRNAVVRNCNFTNGSTYHNDGFIRTGVPRIYDCNFNAGANMGDAIILKNCEYRSAGGGSKTTYLNCKTYEPSGTGKLENCEIIFRSLDVQYLNGAFIWNNCTVSGEAEYARLRLNQGSLSESTPMPSIYGTVFNINTIFDNSSFWNLYMEDCKHTADYAIFNLKTESEGTGLYKREIVNCEFNYITDNAPNNFVWFGPFAYTIGQSGITFTNCTFNFDTTKTIMYAYSQVTNGKIIFDNCTFNNKQATKLFEACTQNFEDLQFIFRNTVIPDNLDVSNISNTQGISLIIE